MRLVASDLDGTLLTSDHKISSRSKQVLTELVAQGVPFVFATGRHSEDVRYLNDRLPIASWKITANGGQVITPTGELFSHSCLSSELVQQVLQVVQERMQDRAHDKVAVNFYTDRQWLTNSQHVVDYSQARDFDFTAELTQLSARDDVIKIFFLGDNEDLQAVAELLTQHITSEMTVAFSLPTCLEVMPSHVNKAVALRLVCQHLGITMQDVYAFGDGMNDVEMLAEVGYGHIMANGAEALKEQLPHLPIIADNEAHGVALQLEKLLAEINSETTGDL